MAKSEGSLDVLTTMDVDYLLGVLKSLRVPRSTKEAALRRIREIERETGQELYGNYNGRASRNPSELARVEEERENRA